MHLEILTPDKSLFSGEVSAVTLPGAAGEFQVLSNHAALVASLQSGIVRIKQSNGHDQSVSIEGGVVEVLNNSIVVLA
ncbi:MAG: ATP synthase F1 subunit epsilon [Bacteroidia bacterium]|nr:ATP synthase F1 subunit epsilon [Bacteroidia bacterium]